MEGDMNQLSEELKSIRNEDGTLGVQNDIKGEILQETKFGRIKLYHIKKFCPYCPAGIEQPVEQVVVYKGLNNVDYHCEVCCVQYYYLQNTTYKMRPEAELKSMGFPLSTPTRKPYELHYIEARESKWYEDINYEETEVVSGLWTMATEACAQFFHKQMSGKAPGYFVGLQLLDNIQETITEEDSEKFLQAYTKLKEKGFF